MYIFGEIGGDIDTTVTEPVCTSEITWSFLSALFFLQFDSFQTAKKKS